MKISLDWLAELVEWDDSPRDLAVKLTAAGLNVEGVEDYRQGFPGVVVAKVLHREQHPDADRLSLCRVDDGTGEPVQVVCGAPNVREGLTVLFARVGAVLPGNFKIKKSKIRGVESRGMVCSANELELGGDSAGIMELETDLPPGASADELYGFQDTVLDIEVTPNRPDWLSHLGVAREVAAIYGTKVSVPRAWSSQQSSESLGWKVKIEDFADCPRYTAFGARDLAIGPSPDWIQHRLRAVGSRPINNIVDITNYVMLEMGQPLHAFDQARLEGTTITVRRAETGSVLKTLDDEERKLAADDLLICDETGPVALAGVMGGANSEVGPETTEILLESASFSPSLVRATSRRLGLTSEASYRFERGTDWGMVEKAAHRVLFLLQEHAGARIVSDWADRNDPDRKAQEPVPLRLWQVNRVLGTKLSTDAAAQALQNLGLKVQPMGNPDARNAQAVNMMVEVPTFRRDLLQEIDLIEEIARSHGYDNMITGHGFRGLGGGTRQPLDRALQHARNWFCGNGFNEIVTSTFFGPEDLARVGLPEDDFRNRTLAVMNPHHGGDTTLRTLLLPALLDVLRRNLNTGARLPIRLFQVNRTYWPEGVKVSNPQHPDDVLLPEEPLVMQFAVTGRTENGLGGIPADLLEIKGALEALSVQLRLPLALEPEDCEPWLEAGGQWSVRDSEDRVVGSAGRVGGEILDRFEVEQPVAVCEIHLDALDPEPRPVRYAPFVRFPAVKRDLSLLVPDGISCRQITEVVKEAGGPHLAETELFDVYRGQGIPEGTGAYGIRLKFRSAKGNLKGKTVDRSISAIFKDLSDRLKIEPRSLD